MIWSILCWTASKSVSLEELLGHGTLSRHPKEGNLHNRALDGLNLIGWKDGRSVFYMIKYKISVLCVMFFFVIKCQSWLSE